MLITKIDVRNYRLLKDFSIDLREDFSLVVGKNNTGKTSLVSVLEKFILKEDKFSYNDFCIPLRKDFLELEKGTKDSSDIKITLDLFIEYNEADNLRNIPILNLDPKENTFKLSFEYLLEKEESILLLKDFKKYMEQHVHTKDILYFLERNHSKYFKTIIRAVDPNDETVFKVLRFDEIRKIINLQTVNAKRGVANGAETGQFKRSNSALSKLSHDYFKNSDDPNATDRIGLQDALIQADEELTKGYQEAFKDVVSSIKSFTNDSSVKIRSTLDAVSLLKDNSSVVYDDKSEELPEDHNGLGYMNLFAILFKLHIIFDSFKKTYSPTEDPADINLLIIEEPEAHTHPQMQYTFIKNVKVLLTEQKKTLTNLQTVMSTHSAHITSQADFDDIKYFLRSAGEGNVLVKNLSKLQLKKTATDDEKRAFKFLKQYLTLHKSELFFADKIIFVEGDTERILLPAMIKKIDAAHKGEKDYIPLLAQSLSVVDVGANSQIFESFLDFLEIKTLIITDIDAVRQEDRETKAGKKIKVRAASRVKEGTWTANNSIKYYLGKSDIPELIAMSEIDKVVSKNRDKEVWEKSDGGQVRLAFQIPEAGYHARSFEDAFISLNGEFLKKSIADFSSLKSMDRFDEDPIPDAYDLANDCVDNKPGFAIDILLLSDENFSNWHTPQYIEEGLTWLTKQ